MAKDTTLNPYKIVPPISTVELDKSQETCIQDEHDNDDSNREDWMEECLLAMRKIEEDKDDIRIEDTLPELKKIALRLYKKSVKGEDLSSAVSWQTNYTSIKR